METSFGRYATTVAIAAFTQHCHHHFYCRHTTLFGPLRCCVSSLPLRTTQFNPLIMDAGFPKLLADDIVYSAPKVGAAMGYLAPEYITTGRITEKSDVYAFGVIVL
ncbi:hypothetical protein Ahy_A10g051236 isoform C [Arachis hypogaea]|uniref:Serine-threonine/tyrosine-protein kinase catalytic domain-containing protein n=1 Tax=Arachis hypogaea TaxID=3818 RepID=A0A445BC29_ARAHY|nr:hypothetical protein Ahy_A10g051236 isoform A [Arachis hypogaea]RYR36227.1 hypothetical protein Ahy_A10g051236 isoform B [Arachis hypogaea]RYR36228.1 hypothetical protein Ahy_A10g051236 isoform C [Arachis hypogaea]